MLSSMKPLHLLLKHDVPVYPQCSENSELVTMLPHEHRTGIRHRIIAVVDEAVHVRAARLVEQMEANGVVSSPGHNGNREVLAPPAPKE